jgi:hypothetical protein
MENPIFRMILNLITALTITGCATTPLTIEERYSFPELEQVTGLTHPQLMGWEVVDSQSLVIQTGPSQYYLLVLGQRLADLNFAESIIISSTGNRIEAKLDCVEVVQPQCTPGNIPVVIHAIYKLDGRSSVEMVKNRIRQPG